MKSNLENHFSLLLKSLKIEFVREYRFHPTRKWRSDFFLPQKRVLVEIEGGVWMSKARHTSGIGYSNDVEKYNEATVLGFKVLRYTSIEQTREFQRHWKEIK